MLQGSNCTTTFNPSLPFLLFLLLRFFLQQLQTHIFLGVVYYQRLRHMVSDKSQVRATGKINAITQQPVKGRKHGGGIRVGEMERDSLISHGTTFLLRDRLMNSSDRHVTWVCRVCPAAAMYQYVCLV